MNWARIFQKTIHRPVGWLEHSTCKWLLPLAMCLLAVVPGCADLKEVDDLNIVLGLGVDQISPTEVRVTAEIPQVEKQDSAQQAKSSPGESAASIVRSQTATTMEEAIHKLEYTLPHRLFLPNNTVIVFGDAYARQGMNRAIDYLERDRHFRRNQLLVVTHGFAHDLFIADPAPMALHAQVIRKLVKESAQEHRTVNSEQLVFIRDFLSPPQVANLAVVDSAQDNTLMSNGVGLVSKGRLESYLDPNESQFFALLQGDRGISPITIACPDARGADIGLTFRVMQNSARITPLYDGQTVRFQLRVRGRAELERVCPNQKLDPPHRAQLEQYIDKYMERGEQSLVDKLKQQNVDALQLGGVIYQRWPTLWHSLQAQWQDSVYRSTDESYDTQFHIIRNGLSSDSPLGIFTEKSTAPESGHKEKVQ